MYECHTCGEIFSENEFEVQKFTDWVPYGDTNVPMDSYEYYCPYCGSDDYHNYYRNEDEEDE